MIKADEIIRTKRKTVSLSVLNDGRVIVRAPENYSDKKINEILLSSQDWLRKALEGVEKINKKIKDYSIADGGRVPLLGEDFEIRFTHNKKAFIDGRLIFLPAESPANHLEKAFRKIAVSHFRERLDFFCGMSGLDYSSIKITRAKKRWGSCSSDKSICFSVYLVMCPPDVIDYVIVHEMCHLRHFDHSAAFWAEVEKYIPDYKAKKQWLREYRAIVDIFN